LTATDEVTFNKVKVSDKGQISIPVEVQREIGIKKGDELLLIRRGRKILLEKPERLLKLLEDEFADVQSLTETSLASLWSNKTDDVWNQYLKAGKKKKK
jgi:AbrB family looped-hinge helix DNA binding protein